jgi:ribosome modulation factor
MNPKTEGVLAYHAKKPAEVVPYSDNGRRSAWVNGWHDAARAAARYDRS